ncbi:MAG: hypothetical protein OEW12_06915 [Deltaproteobacteria bacterium]|nr:hypothetical protein [Deltaproteobacteria bacterium]
MGDQKNDHQSRQQPPHEAVLLSKIITERKQIQLTFLDGEILTDGIRWHTPYQLGLRGGKVVNKSAIKYWEIVE